MQELINKLNELPIIEGVSAYNDQIAVCIHELTTLKRMIDGESLADILNND